MEAHNLQKKPVHKSGSRSSLERSVVCHMFATCAFSEQKRTAEALEQPGSVILQSVALK